MFRKKLVLKEGTHVFATKKNGNYKDFIFGVVTGVDGKKVGVNGVIVNPVGLKNKIEQKKTGERYRIEYENFADVVNLDEDKCDLIPPEVYSMLDGWIRESLSEFLNNVLSLPLGSERDEAKRIMKNRMETLVDKNLKRTLYSVCRSLKILN